MACVLLELFYTKYTFVVRKPLLDPFRCLSELSLCIFRLWHGSTGYKELIGSNESSIGARTEELRPKQIREFCTLFLLEFSARTLKVLAEEYKGFEGVFSARFPARLSKNFSARTSVYSDILFKATARREGGGGGGDSIIHYWTQSSIADSHTLLSSPIHPPRTLEEIEDQSGRS
ncbi:hypothetical protein LINPERPRIM_LOCUS1296 [Linum perenne]